MAQRQQHLVNGPIQKGSNSDASDLQRCLVEAGRIELPSEITDNREHSCFFHVQRVSSLQLRTDEETTETSLIDLAHPAQAEQGRTSLLCDDRYRPVGEV